MGKKFFILRAHSLESSENTTLKFDSDNDIIIPMAVLDILSKDSLQYNERGKNARKFLEYLNSFKIQDLMSEQGTMQKNGSRIRLIGSNRYANIELELPGLNPVDRECLKIAKGLKQDFPNKPIILVSKDPAIRLKAKSIGISAQNYKDDLYPNLNEQYTGRAEVTLKSGKIDLFYEKKYLTIKDVCNYANIEWVPNLFLILRDLNDRKKSAIARYDGKKIAPLNFEEYCPFGIQTKNAGQLMLKEALLTSPEIAPLVIVKAPAGTGKTYISMAVGLDRTLEQDKIYSQILASAPTETVGHERIGFLPGEIEDKLNPHIGGIKDNVRLLIGGANKKSNIEEDGSYLFDKNKGIIQIQSIGFLRGRTIIDTYFVIDETQNISPDDIKSIVTRAGQGSKFVFLGDPTQIDNPSLNENYNGLVYLSEKMKGNPLAWQVTLYDGESVRSELARNASKIL